MEAQGDLVSIVAHNPVLRTCSEETRKTLFERGRLHTFESGSLLFTDDEPGRRVIFLLRGTLQMGKATSRGRRQIICSPNAFMCGGLCLLFFGERGLAEVRGMESGQLIVVGREVFECLTQSDPVFGKAAWDGAAGCMAHLNNLVTQLSFNKVAERVVTLLLEETHKDGDIVRLTQSDLAACVGTTREVAARCLAGFQADGLIRLGRARITVMDRGRLEREF